MVGWGAITGGRVRRAIANAFWSEGYRRFGLPFARDYLRLAWRSSRRWGDTGEGTIQMLGSRIAYPNHSAALFLAHEIFVNGAYAFRAGRPQPRIVDCGANIGMSVAFFKTLYPNAGVLAFEPDPAAFAWLSRNVEANGWQHVRLVRAAVAERDGEATLHSDGHGGSLVAGLGPRPGCRVEQPVPAVTLSSFLQEPVDFLKLDIEGAEVGVVREIVESGAIRYVDQMVVELHDGERAPGGPASMVRDLESAGLRVRLGATAADGTSLLRAARDRAIDGQRPVEAGRSGA